MTHISSIGAGMFSVLSVASPTTDLTLSQQAALVDDTTFNALFASEIQSVGGTEGVATFINLPDVREFPEMGVPANIVNVPRYGASTSAQIQGQADAPTFELTINYVPAKWAKGTLLGDMVKDGVVRAFRFALLNQEPTSGYASTAADLGVVENSIYYFLGKVEAITVSPQLTDANQAKLTLSMLTEMIGAFTIDPA